MEMLDARERRAAHQRTLLGQYQNTLLCFTMNIAGPVKNSPLIQAGFELGDELLRRQLLVHRIPVLHREMRMEKTGCEAMYVLGCDPLTAKRVAVTVEDGTEAGRLFDMDVLRPDGRKVERQALGLDGRKCLICGGPAQDCARSRAHSVSALQERTTQILEDAVTRHRAEQIARFACQALLYEAATTPKPGLVDRSNSGSHRDMDFFTFQASAAALWPYFERCARIGMETRAEPPTETFSALRTPGLLAEGAMLDATGGVNTHKGAIFSLGILCAAAGRLGPDAPPEELLRECGRMSAGLVSRDFADLTPETAVTTGQKLYLQHGITGIRGQAEAGFPVVLQVGLPKLEAGLAAGLSVNDASCAALLAMMAVAEDTNLISRSDCETQRQTAREITSLLEQTPFPSKAQLQALDDAFIRQNLSPGGTADLLAMVYLLHFLKEKTSFLSL